MPRTAKPPADRGWLRITADSVMLPWDAIYPSDDNPRTSCPREFVDRMAESLNVNGQLVPLLVRTADATDRHELVDGELRYRAAAVAGLSAMRCTVIDCTPAEAALIRVLNFEHRLDLNPIEEARGYRLAMEKHGCRQGELAKMLCLSHGQMSNRLRLLNLPDHWQERVISGDLPAYSARIIAAQANNPEVLDRLEADWQNDEARQSIRRDPGSVIERHLEKSRRSGGRPSSVEPTPAASTLGTVGAAAEEACRQVLEGNGGGADGGYSMLAETRSGSWRVRVSPLA